MKLCLEAAGEGGQVQRLLHAWSFAFRPLQCGLRELFPDWAARAHLSARAVMARAAFDVEVDCVAVV